MKTVASILFSLMFSISSIAQGTFFIKISGNRDLVCGDSLELESQIVNPVQLSIDMFMEGDDFINYQIEKKTSGDIIDSKFRTITSAYDTTYYLEHGLYIFKWLGGCAMCNNPVIEGQVGDWRVVDNYGHL